MNRPRAPDTPAFVWDFAHHLATLTPIKNGSVFPKYIFLYEYIWIYICATTWSSTPQWSSRQTLRSAARGCATRGPPPRSRGCCHDDCIGRYKLRGTAFSGALRKKANSSRHTSGDQVSADTQRTARLSGQCATSDTAEIRHFHFGSAVIAQNGECKAVS